MKSTLVSTHLPSQPYQTAPLKYGLCLWVMGVSWRGRGWADNESALVVIRVRKVLTT